MGSTEVQTPNLDRLAADGMVFSRGYTPTSVCRPSLASMVTGLYPHQHGITGNDPPGGGVSAPDARAAMEAVFAQSETVLEALHAQGYLSHQSGKWWEGNPTDHGFTAAMTHGDVTRGGRHGDDGLSIGREGLQPIKDFVASAHGSPFVLYYAPFIPHTPHNPPDSLLALYRLPGRSDAVAKYYAMITWLDVTVGNLLDYLDAQDLHDNTLVLYAVDNGWLPPIGNMGRFDSRAKMSPYDAGMRTPIVMRWPGKIDRGRDDQSLVSTLDIMPTILSAVGGKAGNLPGIDLRSRQALADRKMVFGALFAHTSVDLHDPTANLKYRYAVRADGWKLIWPYLPNKDVELLITGETTPWMGLNPELYNVLNDPFETINLVEDQPQLVSSMQSALDSWWPIP